ncbi:uncharacterized protein B0H18DRAFT_1120345 [Fomitopsis serialis]|uniref:uncharacterized protein n=1 Tax=Fomitopsis serialis TaxID=139415 RepID=UPI0020081890|nr:uncharacterized protein B0H18DRAFT_1120345 [Neoantrodia serialis]KAH9923485.1 hypothetical protein B0H18DRAFT_1120345 [Neoantrodia serialis]
MIVGVMEFPVLEWAPGVVLSAIENTALVTIKEEPTDNDAQALLNAGSTNPKENEQQAQGDAAASQTREDSTIGVKLGLVDTLKSALTAAVTVQAREIQLEADVALYRGQVERLATRERELHERENGLHVQAARKDAELADARYQWAQERIRVLEANTERERVAREMRDVQVLLDQEKTKGAQGDAAGRAAQANIASLRAERDGLQTELQTTRDAVASAQAQLTSVHERELKAETDRGERAERSALELSKKLVRLQVELRSDNTVLREQVEALTKELEGERAEGSARREQLAAEASSLRLQLKAANENKIIGVHRVVECCEAITNESSPSTELQEISAEMKISQAKILGLETQLRVERAAREAEGRCIGAMTAEAEAERVHRERCGHCRVGAASW